MNIKKTSLEVTPITTINQSVYSPEYAKNPSNKQTERDVCTYTDTLWWFRMHLAQ